MNLLFLTQNKTLSIFYDVSKIIRNDVGLGKTGFYIAGSSFYDIYKRKNENICSKDYELLKEWDIIEKSASIEPNLKLLAKLENKYGNPVLWNAIVSDRNIYNGKKSTLEQDYKNRYSHERILAILQIAIVEIEQLFDRLKPDAVISFICVTIGEYISYLIAQSRNIPFLNLRPSRIRNYFYGGEGIFEPSERLNRIFKRLKSNGIQKKLKQEAIYFLSEVRKTHAMYEGVLPVKNEKTHNIKANRIKKIRFSSKIARKTIKFVRYYYGPYSYDNNYVNPLYALWINRFKKPFRVWLTSIYLKKFYININRLDKIRYAFFPLHKEPEVTLLVYGPSYLNQIEVIRNIARSLPIDMKLVVKEHPASVGYRHIGYYKKLLEIPNVMLAPPVMTSRELVNKSSLITIIGGSIGLEALIMKKPVIHFGNVPFCLLSNKMIRKINNINESSSEIKDLLINHVHNENEIITYVASVMQSSVPIDFYSVLLGKKNVYREVNKSEIIEQSTHIKRLSKYIIQYFNEYAEK